jgi:6-phosphogluconolactonase (cycloisomerase 2 family)
MLHLPCWRPNQLAIALGMIFLLFLLIAGCVISPRRVVNENPSPTPTPGISPTPTPGTTPSATPTPSPMAATAPAQFLFLGEADAPLITGFRINSDGSLVPVPGSPFAISAPVHSLTAVHDTLFAGGENGVAAYRVNRESGSIQRTDSAGSPVLGANPYSSASGSPQLAVLDSNGRFMVVADVDRAELRAFRVEDGKLVALPRAAVPISSATTSIAVVKP